MGMVVKSNATIMCPYALGTSNLIFGSNMNIKTGGGTILTTNDNIPGGNFTPFPMCTNINNPAVASATNAAMGVLTPAPCAPTISGPWMPEKTNVNIKGSPVLTQNCKLQCGYGGVISIVEPGQTNFNS